MIVEPDIKPLLGGLNTKLPPVMLPANTSPDLLNVLARDGTIKMRGGFTPLFRDRMLGDAVENVAYRTTSRLANTVGSVDGDFVISPGCMLAGHRAPYATPSGTGPALTIALWFKPTSLVSQHGGNAQSAGAPFNPAPFTVKVLPIISKGPVKKSEIGSGAPVAEQWGVAANSGMPFCIYIFNSGTGTVPVWTFRLSAHVLIAGNWSLQTVTSAEPVEIGSRYHIIAAVTPARIALRVARIREGEPAQYNEATQGFTGVLACNLCPIQVFDCPQFFPQGTTAGSATQRPGLGFTTAASGGYWYSTMRPEGVIDDISIWYGDRTLSTMDRLTKVAWTGQADLLNLWAMGGDSLDYVKEETGRGNHLYFVPRGPISVPDDGGKEGGSWFFNGTTSWALVNTETPNWRAADYTTVGNYASAGATTYGAGGPFPPNFASDAAAAWIAGEHTGRQIFSVNTNGELTTAYITNNNVNTLGLEQWSNGQPANGTAFTIETVTWKPGAMYALVRDNCAHGITAEFWVDSIELYEQVIVEIHSVIRLSLNRQGQIIGVCRDGGVSPRALTAQAIGENYGAAVVSTTVVEPGRRYHVALMRSELGGFLRLYVNGFLEASVVVNPANYDLTPGAGNSHAPGGMTFGIGSFQRLIRAIVPVDPFMASSNQVANDVNTGFVGRIETVRILASPSAPMIVKRHGPEGKDDWRFRESPTFQNDGNTLPMIPEDIYDTVRNVGRGAVPVLGTQQQTQGGDLWPVANVIGDSSTSPTAYALRALTLETEMAEDQFGHDGLLTSIGVRIYYVLAYFRLNEQDLDSQYGGAYVKGFERRYPTTGAAPLVPTQVRHPRRSTHAQFSLVRDANGLLGEVLRCCAEADQMNDANPAVFAADGFNTHRQRPYLVKSPKELGLKWITGMARPSIGSTPVLAVADYDVQTQGRRLTVTGCGRSLYWAKPAWDDGFLLFAGGTHSYVAGNFGSALNITGTTPKTTIQVTCWVRPLRLDGIRMIATNRDVTNADRVNWMLHTDNGALTVIGTEAASTSVWRFTEGQAPGGVVDVSRTTSLKVGVWNHVCMVLGGTGPTIYVNGQAIPLVNTNTLVGANQTNAWGAGASDLGNTLSIGGQADGLEHIALPASAPTLRFVIESWYGHIADFHERPSADTTRYSGTNGFPPPMFTVDPADSRWWRMDEGTGWALLEELLQDVAEVRIREFMPIAGGIRQESGRRYSHVNFRDRVILTNGAHRPLQAQFLGFDVPSPWLVDQLGVDAPVSIDMEFDVATTVGTTLPAGVYQIAMSFVTRDGLESEPTLIYTATLGPFATIRITITNLPRAPDPQVVSRRIYVSATGGGAPIFNRDILDNESSTIEVEVFGTGGGGLNPGTRLPAPRARHVAVAGSSLVLADLPDEDAGQNAIAFSSADEISFFTTASTALIDSEDGRAIVGIGHNLGQAFFSKADSIYVLSVDGIVDATQAQANLRLNQSSDGIGGGTAPGSNLLYGAGDRGVFSFDNTNLSTPPLSDAIERTWRKDVDRSDVGLYSMGGAYWRAFSQYWISVRLRGQSRATTILVFDVGTGSWTLLTVSEHSWMGMVEILRGEAVPVLGTTDGRVLGYRDELCVDYLDTEENIAGVPLLTGSAGLSGSSTALTVAGGNFPTMLAGLQGAAVEIVYNDGVGSITATRRIIANDDETLMWDEPLADFVSFVSFELGGYDGYWTSPWVSSGHLGAEQRLQDLDVEFVPQAGTLRVDIAAIRQGNATNRPWPTAVNESERFDVPMEKGFSERAMLARSEAMGNYHRVRFGTYGVNQPFALIGFKSKLFSYAHTSSSGRRT